MIPSVQLDSSAAIRLARGALAERDRFLFGNEKLESEFYALDLLSAEERYMAIDVALQEISPACRRGPQPPNDVAKGRFPGIFYMRFAGIPLNSTGRFILSSRCP